MNISERLYCGIRKGILYSTDFLYPPRCPLCDRILLSDESLICSECKKRLRFLEEPVCGKCGRPIDDRQAQLCYDCSCHSHFFDQGRAAFTYEKQVRRSLNRLKFYNRREYIPFYGACLEKVLRGVLRVWKPECIIPVPMNRKKRRIRGFDQASLLARELGRLADLPVMEHALERVRYTDASKRLGRQSRRRNMRGAFRAAEGSAIPDRVLLIDDIYTTGTTMDEAARVLRKAGARHIFFLTVCIGRS